MIEDFEQCAIYSPAEIDDLNAQMEAYIAERDAKDLSWNKQKPICAELMRLLIELPLLEEKYNASRLNYEESNEETGQSYHTNQKNLHELLIAICDLRAQFILSSGSQ